MATVLINQLDYGEFSAEQFEESYEAFCLRYMGKNKYPEKKGEILADLQEDAKILSVRYLEGNKIYFLVKKGSKLNWRKISENECYQCYKKESLSPCEEENLDIIHALLLNALSKQSNVSGHLHIFQAMKNVTKPYEGIEIYTSDYSIQQGRLLRTQAVFSRYKDEKVKEWKQAYEICYGQHDSLFSVKASKESEEEDVFYFGKRHHGAGPERFEFDNMSFVRPVKNTKMDLLHRLVKNFNKMYAGMASLKFRVIEIETERMENFNGVARKRRLEKDYAALEDVNILCDEEEVAVVAEKAKCLWEAFQDLGLRIHMVKKPEAGKAHISLYHDAKHYKKKGLRDPKKELHAKPQLLQQGLTIEKLRSTPKKSIVSVAKKLITELLVKKELQARQLSKWKFEELNFFLAMQYKAEDQEETVENLFCFMEVAADGSFKISSEIKDLPSRYRKIYRRFLKELEDKNGNLCLVEKDSNINRIDLSKYQMYTDWKEVERLDAMTKKEKPKNKYRIRSGKYLANKWVFPYAGKHKMRIDDVSHYTVGVYYPATNIAKMNRLYSIRPLEDSKEISEILELLVHDWVRSDSTESVRPYPFKYMMEYLRTRNPGKNLYFM